MNNPVSFVDIDGKDFNPPGASINNESNEEIHLTGSGLNRGTETSTETIVLKPGDTFIPVTEGGGCREVTASGLIKHSDGTETKTAVSDVDGIKVLDNQKFLNDQGNIVGKREIHSELGPGMIKISGTIVGKLNNGIGSAEIVIKNGNAHSLFIKTKSYSIFGNLSIIGKPIAVPTISFSK